MLIKSLQFIAQAIFLQCLLKYNKILTIIGLNTF